MKAHLKAFLITAVILLLFAVWLWAMSVASGPVWAFIIGTSPGIVGMYCAIYYSTKR